MFIRWGDIFLGLVHDASHNYASRRGNILMIVVIIYGSIVLPCINNPASQSHPIVPYVLCLWLLQPILAGCIVVVTFAFVTTRYCFAIKGKKTPAGVFREAIAAALKIYRGLATVASTIVASTIATATKRIVDYIGRRDTEGQRPPPPVRLNFIAQRGEHYAAAVWTGGSGGTHPIS